MLGSPTVVDCVQFAQGWYMTRGANINLNWVLFDGDNDSTAMRHHAHAIVALHD